MTNQWRIGAILFYSILFQGCLAQNTSKVCFKDQCFNVEVVYKNADMRRGLQFRKSLAADAGMLFVFGESRKHSFWMKDTLMSLDIIWLDAERRVTHVAADLPPCASDPCPSYAPTADSLYALEVKAGEAGRLGIKLNDPAVFHINQKEIK